MNINLFLIWKKALTGHPCKSSQLQFIWPWCEMAVQLLMDARVDGSHFKASLADKKIKERESTKQ